MKAYESSTRFAAGAAPASAGPLSRLRVGTLILGAIIVAGTVGYWLAGWSWLDSLYMVVITMSTVGYREMGEMTPALKLFTIAVIVFGVSTALYIMGGFVRMVLEGEVNRALGSRRASKEIERLSGHVIVCGFGRMGEIVAGELAGRSRPLVVLDKNPDQIALAVSLGHLALNADATEEDSLLQAGIPRAKALVVALPSDADNVFITLTARNLNPHLQIIARGELRSTEKKLIQAGANRVVLPAAAGAMRMAAMLTRPSMVELIELVGGKKHAEIAIDELRVPSGSPLVGITVRDSQTRSRHGLLIVAIRRADDRLLFSPSADTLFQPEDNVIAMGKIEDIERFRAEYGV